MDTTQSSVIRIIYRNVVLKRFFIYLNKISFHHSRVNARLNFFSNRVIAVWNSLPETVVTAPTIDIFKSLLMKLEPPIV